MEYGFFSIIPTIITVGMALITHNVYISLVVGLLFGNFILNDCNILLAIDGVISSITTVFQSPNNVINILAISFLGGMVYLIQVSGGVNGFVDFLTNKTNLINSKKKANMLSWIIGLIVFVSANMSSLITGAITKPLNDKYLTSHEKQAYIVHAVGVPVCALIPLSSWGAYMIGLLESSGIANSVSVLIKSIPCSIYVIVAVFIVPVIIFTGFDFGSMKKAEKRASESGLLDAPGKGRASQEETDKTDKKSSGLILGLPIISMIVVSLIGMYITGDGNILNGNGMRAYLWGVMFAIALAVIMITGKKILSISEVTSNLYKGWLSMLPIVIILIFALALGNIVKELDTGAYLASVFSSFLNPALLPTIVFIISMIISFSTGSSWGTMAVMVPLSMPLALAVGVNIPLVAGAIWSGGIFGDHSSPISDSTIVACAATGCDVIDHVKTQLPYNLLSAALSIVVFLILGFTL